MSTSIIPIACSGVGSSFNNLTCCYPDSQNSTACHAIFSGTNNTVSRGCFNKSQNCVTNCADKNLLYRSFVQDDGYGNGRGPITRYQACVNIPSIVRYHEFGQLSQDYSRSVDTYHAANATNDELQAITSTVTDCLSSTCRNSRQNSFCYDEYCSPVKLLANSSSPNVTAINQCLNKLCTGGWKSLPWANTDIVGIGVYSSYILQCIFIAILCISFFLALTWRLFRPKQNKPRTESIKPLLNNEVEPSKHKEAFITLLTDFHKTQCFFSITLMIASFTQNIYNTNMLITFLLVPLATNGIAPVVFAYLFLVHYLEADLATMLYTFLTYLLSSIVYWTLYAHVSSLDPASQQTAYQQFMFKLSAIPACGDYSALAVCPNYAPIGLAEVETSSTKIKVLTPIIWTLSTIIFASLLAYQYHQHKTHPSKNMETEFGTTEAASGESTVAEMETAGSEEKIRSQEDAETSTTYKSPLPSPLFYMMIIIMLACLGMQLSTLAIGKALNMMDPTYWGFGQVIAVTVWAPPVLGWLWKEVGV